MRVNDLLVLADFAEGAPDGWTPEAGDHETGLLGGSLWTALDGLGAGLGLLHFTGEDAAEAHLQARVESYPEDRAPRDVASAIRHLRLVGHHGMDLEGTHVGGYLTLAHRLAAPGYGDVESRAMTEDLESISLLEGYAGHLRGVNVALPDEVWAVVFWSEPPIVPHTGVDDGLTVAHYRRVR